MGIQFKSPLALSAHRAIAHSDSAQTLEVKVAVKTAAHPEFGNGSSNGYVIDSVEGAYLEFTPGNTYKFDQSDNSNTGHPLRFYQDAAKTTAYTTGVTTNGTPGTAGAYTQIIPSASTNPILYYQCSAHSLMGSYVKFGTGSLGGEADSAIKILLTVKNVSTGTLTSGTVVRVATTNNPPSGNVLEVNVADNSAASTMPAIGILIEDITAGSEGDCVAFGRASGFSTSGFTEGDTLYVNTSGGFTTTKPTGAALIQRIGQVIKVHASNGSIEVFGAGRANDVPNIPQNQLWLGNSSGVATATSHTVENISNVTTSTKTDGQALVWDATNNYWKNGDVAAAGGGGAELSIERDVITATANQTAFTISSDITASSDTQVYIDGVYQAKNNYTTSGSVITFSTGVPAGAKVEVVHFISVLSKVYTDTFTGNGSTVDFTASKDVSDENVTQIYIDGVYQSKDNYTTSGTTITFSTAPSSGSAIEVVHFTPATYSTLNSNQFNGTGSQTDFTLTQAVNVDTSFVFIQGVYQEKDQYSINGTTLTFVTAPLSGYSIEVITVGAVSIFNDTLFLDNFNGTGSQVDYTLSTSPASENAIDVYINGLYQQKDTFSLTGDVLTLSTAAPSGSTIEVKSIGGLNNVATSSGSGGIDWQTTPKTANFTAVASEGYFVNTTSAAVTVTLPSSPTAGDELTIVDYAGTADTNNITITSSNNINGSSDDVFINYERGGVSIVYVDATQGWVAYNAANETNSALVPPIPPLTVDYLVVAGGAGGGHTHGGGGGAGGLRTSYGSTTGGGGPSESTLSLNIATNYSVSVGSGGSGGSSAANGIDSTFSSITSTGGGYGGTYPSAFPGITGGSGGGAGAKTTSGSVAGGSAVTSPVTQGYAGGSTNYFSNAYAGGGGGGANAIGASTVNSYQGGNGGTGLAVNILNSTNAGTASIGEVSGSDVYFAGGGGGCGDQNTTGGVGGSGGTGGGGDGDYIYTDSGDPGIANTGGGGGGSRSLSSGGTGGGAGGSGVVVLRYPYDYTITVDSGITEASGSPFTEGSDKVSVFTGGTGNISFS